MDEKRKQYLLNYQKTKVTKIGLWVTPEKAQQIKDTATACNMSVNGFIKSAIDEKIDNVKNGTT